CARVRGHQLLYVDYW
nr:immunoglobulin heavy chain junction region [Macaca mulatta]MOV38561.1 immunoglobulin heavy chain junction region [Macaca mulatta]MOV38661.1 immunoglobulin heavy chain junction region [Macaca mulatta]MOV39185.1 immunoglobulin heavy chain junction region [Macaca mulatta]MOV39541.1 immunoglobulin heavy chain junction region [Macaca mulatta]